MRRIRVPLALILSLSLPGVAFAQVPPPPSEPAAQPAVDESISANSAAMTEEQKTERAKEIYKQAEELAAQGKWAEATPLYEEAYYLVPGKHGFAHKVGIAAWNAGDCTKADIYLKHFLQYGDPEKMADKIEEAKMILGEISMSGCAAPAPTTTTTTTANPVEEENPLENETSTRDNRRAANEQAAKDKKAEKRPLLIGGAVLLSIGAAGVIMGATTLGLASGAANDLSDLSSNATQTGFPVGDYSCRDTSEPCPFDLEQKLKTMNTLSYVGFGVGGAALITGVALISLWAVNKKKRGAVESNPADDSKVGAELSGLGPMMLPGGGGGAMAEIRF